MLKTSDFNFDLPDELIAQEPFFPREKTKMLAFDGQHISDLQVINLADFLQEGMAEKIANWLQDYPKENFGAVVGATHSANIKTMRNLLKDRILLIPGIGAQGGDLKTVLQEAKDSSETPNILVNSSRGIIFASKGKDFATAAREQARKLTQEMKNALSKG